MKEILKTVFVASDGKGFDIKKDCEEYEMRLNNLRYFVVHCNPNLTEGRGFYGRIFFVSNNIRLVQHKIITYMEKNYGNPIVYAQGYSETKNWTLPKEVDKEEFDSQAPVRVGDYTYKTTVVFMSDEQIEGFPTPIQITKNGIKEIK